MNKSTFINRVLLIMNEAGMTDDQGNSLIGADTAQVDRYIEGSFENAWRMLAVNVPKSWLATGRFIHNPQHRNSDGTGYVILPEDFYLLAKFKLKSWQKPIYEASMEDEKIMSIQSNKYTRGSAIRPVGVIGKEYIDKYEIGSYDSFEIAANAPSLMPAGGDAPKTSLYFNTTNQKLYIGYRGETTVVSWQLIDTIYPQFETIPHNEAIFDIVDGEIISRYNLYKSEDGQWYYESSLKTLDDHVQVLNYFSVPTSDTDHLIESALYIPNVTPLTDVELTTEIKVDQRIIEPLAYLTAGSVFTIFGKDQISANLIEKGMMMIPGYRKVKGNNVTIKQ